MLNDYLLLVRTEYLQGDYIQAYIDCQKALQKYPDNYDLMFESARLQLRINPDVAQESVIQNLKSNSLYHVKNLYLQSMLYEIKQQFSAEIEILSEILTSWHLEVLYLQDPLFS